MALFIDNVTVNIGEEEIITSVWINMVFKLFENPYPSGIIAPSCYRSKQAYLDGEDELPIYELTTVPGYLNALRMELTAASYANMDTEDAHRLLKDLLELGDTHPDWEKYTAVGCVWTGLGVGEVEIQMPVPVEPEE